MGKEDYFESLVSPFFIIISSTAFMEFQYEKNIYLLKDYIECKLISFLLCTVPYAINKSLILRLI